MSLTLSDTSKFAQDEKQTFKNCSNTMNQIIKDFQFEITSDRRNVFANVIILKTKKLMGCRKTSCKFVLYFISFTVAFKILGANDFHG